MRIFHPLSGLFVLAAVGLFTGCGTGGNSTPAPAAQPPKPDPAGRAAMSHLGPSQVTVLPLVAGQQFDAGTVTITNDAETLFIEYTLHDPWSMHETQVYVGTEPPEGGSPGQFPYHVENLDAVTSYSFAIPLEEVWVCGTELYMAVHAVVVQNGEGIFISETAWATGEFRFETGWGGYTTYEVAPYCPLPRNDIQFTGHYPGPNSYWRTTLYNVGSGYSVQSGIPYTGWCVDLFHYLVPGQLKTGHLYSSVGAILPAHLQDDDWDMVNYILNHKQGTPMDVQYAIWFFIGGGAYPSDPEARAMIQEAQLRGEGYIPGSGDVTAIIVDAGLSTQITIIEVKCDC
ncbi:MAG TPA: hypothetical protein VEI97_02015 [bacterium]|nr:hypothetical protein [bacterium]